MAPCIRPDDSLGPDLQTRREPDRKPLFGAGRSRGTRLQIGLKKANY